MLKVDSQDRTKLIDPLYQAGWGFWVLILALLAVIGWAIFMYVRQLTLGLGITGMNRPVYWGVYMVNFIFFIGISHAGTLISAILRVTGAEWRRPITRIAEAITAFALMVGTLQIIIDMAFCPYTRALAIPDLVGYRFGDCIFHRFGDISLSSDHPRHGHFAG